MEIEKDIKSDFFTCIVYSDAHRAGGESASKPVNLHSLQQHNFETFQALWRCSLGQTSINEGVS